jgi:hypothetical protein
VVCTATWASTAAAVAPPIEFHDSSGQWTAAMIQRPLEPGINFGTDASAVITLILEMVVSHAGSKEQLYVFSSENVNGGADAPNRFAHELKAAFDSFRSTHFTEQDATEMGHHGRTLEFDLVNETRDLECRLFVFTDGSKCWAVLQTRPKDEPARATPAFAPLRKKQPAPKGVVELEPFRVQGIPLTSFPISFETSRDRITGHVRQIIVREVPPSSTTEQAGVKPGDQIIAINGRSIREFHGGITIDSELGRIFLNRRPGDTVHLDLIAADSQQPYSVTLQIPTFFKRIGQGLPPTIATP